MVVKKGYFPSYLKHRASNPQKKILLSTMSKMNRKRENVSDCQRYFVIYLFPYRKLYNNLLRIKKKRKQKTNKKIENNICVK